MPLQSKDTDARKSVCSGDLATLSPRKKRAMSWSEDCHGRPRARTTVSSSTSSSFVLYERPPTPHINVAWGWPTGRVVSSIWWVGLGWVAYEKLTGETIANVSLNHAQCAYEKLRYIVRHGRGRGFLPTELPGKI